MSVRTGQPIPIIEVSADRATGFDPSTGTTVSGETAADVAQQMGVREVALAFSRRSTFIRSVRLPDAPRAEVAKILAVQIGQFLPASLGQLAYDFKQTDDRNHEGRVVVIGSIKADQLRTTLAQLEEVGVTVRTSFPVSFGAALIAAEHGTPDCVVVEETSEGVAVDVVVGGELRYSRLAPMPGSAKGISTEVQRTLGVAGVQPVPVLALGGLAYAGAAATIAARSREALAANLAHVGVSVEPPEAKTVRSQRQQSAKARLTMLFAAGAAALGVVAYLDYSEGSYQADLVARRWKTKISQATKEETRAEAGLTAVKAVKSKLDLAFTPAQRFTDILKIAGNTAPDGIWLTGITLDRGRPVTLRGTAKSSEAVAAYLSLLSSMPRFRDVDLSVAANAVIDETPVVQFSLAAHAVGNLPLIEETKKSARR